MIRTLFVFLVAGALTTSMISCGGDEPVNTNTEDTVKVAPLTLDQRLNSYASVSLNPDISMLSEEDKIMLGHLINACKVMDELFWLQTYGNKDTLLSKTTDPIALKLLAINYGPWDRLNDNEPFLEGIGKKPIGSAMYPSDIKYLPFIDMKFEDKISAFTVIKRSEEGDLYTQPYNVAYKELIDMAVEHLNLAADACSDPKYKEYLKMRAEAFKNDDYYKSDLAWMDFEENLIEIIIGPIESEEDRFYNIKASYEAFLSLRDLNWSKKMKVYSDAVPEIKNVLPVDDKIKSVIIFSKANIGVFDAIFFGGYANAGAKSISINHPKDGRILMERGSRKLQFKNLMQAKFDKIMVPIANVLIAENERKNVKFDAFFINNMVYEFADAVVVKTTVDNKTPVKEALKDFYPTINSLKADILNLYILTQLHEKGVIKECELLDNYVVFMANILRSVRFGATYSQGSSNIIAFNVLEDMKAFTRDEKTGTYSVNFEKMKSSITEFSGYILTIMAEGDYESAKDLIIGKGNMSPTLQKDILKVQTAGIPTDIVFEQGPEVLGIK